MAAAALMRFARWDEVRAALDEADVAGAHTDERWCEPEIHRLRAELVLAASPGGTQRARPRAAAAAEGDNHLRVSLAVRAQGARLGERRATETLARLRGPGA